MPVPPVGWLELLAAAALLINALSLANMLRRHLRLRLPQVERPARATLILPVTGAAPGLATLFAALGAQTQRPRRLLVAVESETDPAFARARALLTRLPFPAEVIVAGAATHQGQKCRNQEAALARIDGNDDAIVLLDADTRPQEWWLSALVSPLADGSADLVSGLRWQEISRHGTGAHLVAAIDRSLMLLPRLGWGWSGAVWGGSLALTPAAAGRLGLGAVLARTLSDDLSIARAADEAGLRILTRSALLVPSPGDAGLGEGLRFAARQYRIVHLYRPWLWRLAFAVVGCRLLAWTALLAASLQGASWPAFALAALAALATLTQWLVGELGRRVGLPDPPAIRLVQLALGPLQVLADLFHLAAILAAARTTPLRWGHVVYDAAAPDRISVCRRLPFPAA